MSQPGFVEYVESRSVSDISSQHGSIQKYFAHVAGPKNPIQIVINNFSKSCGEEEGCA